MSDKLGPITFGRKHGAIFLGRDLYEDRNYSEKIAYQIDQEVFRMVDESHRDVIRILTDHKDKLKIVADRLLEVQDMEGEELLRLLQDQKPLITDETPLINLARKSIEHLEEQPQSVSPEAVKSPKKAPPAPEPA
jgi:cell division protease FtsH